MQKTLLILFITTPFVFFAQKNLEFEKTEFFLGELEISKVFSVEFEYKNISEKNLVLNYEPITDLVNAEFPNKLCLKRQAGVVSVNFYPEKEGIFSEKLYINSDKGDKIELTISGIIKTITKDYKNKIEDKRLFGDKDITFMAVDATTLRGVAFAKLFIQNIKNKKSYIGICDHYGILINRIPDGTYKISSLVDGFEPEILGTSVDPNRNIAMVLMEKSSIKFKAKKEETLADVNSQPLTEPRKKTIIPDLPLQNEPEVKIPDKKATASSESKQKLNLILLVDVSKSMEKPQRINLLKRSMINLIENYQTSDNLTILTFNDQVQTLVESYSIANKVATIDSIQKIQPSGTTDGMLAIDKSFEKLSQYYNEDAINMIILATDGKMASDSYEDKALYEKIEDMNAKGMLISVLGFGTSQYEIGKLSKIANIGGGLFVNMNIDMEHQESVIVDEIYKTLLKMKR